MSHRNLNILLLSRYSKKGASSRLRTMQYLPELKDTHINVEVFPFFDDSHLNQQYQNGKTSFFKILKYLYLRIKVILTYSKVDLIWIEYETLPWFPWFIEKIFLPKKIPIITDFDDAIFHRYDSHRFRLVRMFLGSKIKKIMKKSKTVIVGNSYLAEYAKQSGSHQIEIIPTVVDLDNYNVNSFNYKKKDFIIGWIGTPTTFYNYFINKLQLLKNLSFHEGFKIAVMSAINDKLRNSHQSIDFFEWSEQDELSFLNSIDIGIMPLIDSPWSKGKCGYKLIQYMACGIPVIASPIGMNTKIIDHGINGFLADTDEEWAKAIKILKKDKHLRKRMGMAGRKKIENEFSLKLWAPKIKNIIKKSIENPHLKYSELENQTILSFGDEWKYFNQKKIFGAEHSFLFNKYFDIFPWESLNSKSTGFDMGCGSGRWAMLVAPKIGMLNCVEPSYAAISVAKKNLSHLHNVNFINSSLFDKPLPPNSQDFGYCLGVLHHIENTELALNECVKMLKPGAPFLVYLYYKLENRSKFYFIVWKITDYLRFLISKLKPNYKVIITNFIAFIVYFPLARLSMLAEKFGFKVDSWLLSSYRKTSFYTMKTDSRDRFGTPLEKRFSRLEIKKMLLLSGLEDIKFSEHSPFWCAVGKKSKKLT